MKLQVFGYNININKYAKDDENIPDDLKEALEVIIKYGIRPSSSFKQKKAAAKATSIRSKKAKEKIENAVNILRLENKNITQYSVAKVSGCSINTVRKYKAIIPGSI